MTFAARALGSAPDRETAVADVLQRIKDRELTSVRVAFADQHGILRGKQLRADRMAEAFVSGVGITSALLLKDTGQINVHRVWASGAGLGEPWMTGAGDAMMLPDPTTFKELPWVARTGWLLCDLYSPDATELTFDTRQLCRSAEQRIAAIGHQFKAGLEVEFHLYKLNDAGLNVSVSGAAADRLDVSHTHLGRMYLAEQRFDQIEPFLEILRSDLTALGMEPRSLEIELGPSQVELTFSPAGGLEAADQAVLLRSAVKQIAHRHGFHATFMGRPGIARSFTSGWHLHQSLVDAGGANLFTSTSNGRPLSELGNHYLAGLLEHGLASCLLTTPTITGYKRYQPESLAPDRVSWSYQHRGAMLRVIGGAKDSATRIENRVGDSAANPYLFLASQMLSGLAGLVAGDSPPASTNSPYEAEAGPKLPRNLQEAIDAFATSAFYRRALGDAFVDYLVAIKQAEWDRFMSTVTDWEQREYFELF